MQRQTVGQKRNFNFDATMGAYVGAEVCELIGNFLSSLLNKDTVMNQIGLYRNDGLVIIKKTSSP